MLYPDLEADLVQRNLPMILLLHYLPIIVVIIMLYSYI